MARFVLFQISVSDAVQCAKLYGHFSTCVNSEEELTSRLNFLRDQVLTDLNNVHYKLDLLCSHLAVTDDKKTGDGQGCCDALHACVWEQHCVRAAFAHSAMITSGRGFVLKSSHVHSTSHTISGVWCVEVACAQTATARASRACPARLVLGDPRELLPHQRLRGTRPSGPVKPDEYIETDELLSNDHYGWSDQETSLPHLLARLVSRSFAL